MVVGTSKRRGTLTKDKLPVTCQSINHSNRLFHWSDVITHSLQEGCEDQRNHGRKSTLYPVEHCIKVISSPELSLEGSLCSDNLNYLL